MQLLRLSDVPLGNSCARRVQLHFAGRGRFHESWDLGDTWWTLASIFQEQANNTFSSQNEYGTESHGGSLGA